MKKTVLALFDKRTAVESAHRDLKSKNCPASHFQFFSSTGDSKSTELAMSLETCTETDIRNPETSLYRTLREWNVPVSDALELTEAVCEGALLVAVSCLETDVDFVIESLEKNGALHLETCFQVFREHRTGQRFDDTTPPFLKIARATTEPLQEVKGRGMTHSASLNENQLQKQNHESVKVYDLLAEKLEPATEHNLNE